MQYSGRLPIAGGNVLPRGLPTLDPARVEAAGRAQTAAIQAARTPTYQTELSRLRTAQAQSIAASRARATIATPSFTPTPSAAIRTSTTPTPTTPQALSRGTNPNGGTIATLAGQALDFGGNALLDRLGITPTISPGLPLIRNSFGGRLGAFAGSQIRDWLNPSRPRTESNDPFPGATPIPRGVQPPFFGGQSPGISYDVDIAKNGQPFGTAICVGAIGGIVRRNENAVSIVHNSGASFVDIEAGLGSGSQAPFWAITAIRRRDGQPDTGGNPAPLPGANSLEGVGGLGRSPAIAPARTGTPTQNPASPINPNNLRAPTPPASPTPQRERPSTPADRLTPPAGAPSPQDLANRALPLGILPLLTPGMGTGSRSAATIGRQATTGIETAPGTGSTGGTGTSTPPNLICRYDGLNIKGGVDQANMTIGAVQLFMQQDMMNKLNTIDTKLGPQINNGGIGGLLGRTWNFLQIDRVLNVLTWIGVLHNAYMLSNALTQTLFSMISTALDVFGIEDSEGNALDVGQIVGQFTENFFKGLIGANNVDGIKAGWKSFNRIYQAATNVVYSIQSMFYSMAEILEIISDYVGKIGNALKKAGVVLQNAFNWMNPSANYANSGFFRFLSNTQEAVELLDVIVSEVKNIQDTAEELVEQKNEFEQALSQGEELISGRETDAKNTSTRPNQTITNQDERRAEAVTP